jgi:hypothetical protein
MPLTTNFNSPFDFPPPNYIVSKLTIKLYPALEQVTFVKPVEAAQVTYPGS